MEALGVVYGFDERADLTSGGSMSVQALPFASSGG